MSQRELGRQGWHTITNIPLTTHKLASMRTRPSFQKSVRSWRREWEEGGGRGRGGGGSQFETAQHPRKSKRSYVKGVCSKTADADVKNANAMLWGEREPDLGREAVCMASEPQRRFGGLLLLHSAVWFRILPEISEGSFISPFSGEDSTGWKEARQRRPYADRQQPSAVAAVLKWAPCFFRGGTSSELPACLSASDCTHEVCVHTAADFTHLITKQF